MKKADILMALEYYEDIIEGYEDLDNIIPRNMPCTIDKAWTKEYEMACIAYEILEKAYEGVE